MLYKRAMSRGVNCVGLRTRCKDRPVPDDPKTGGSGLTDDVEQDEKPCNESHEEVREKVHDDLRKEVHEEVHD